VKRNRQLDLGGPCTVGREWNHQFRQWSNIFRSLKFNVKNRRNEKYLCAQSICIGWCIVNSSRFSLLSVSQGWKNVVVCILN